MIGNPKPFASLSSGLLARKGAAKPAMRPQGYTGFGNLHGALDDLGWNDMGSAEAEALFEPAPARTQVVLPPPPGVPPVLRQRAQLHQELASDDDETAVVNAGQDETPPPVSVPVLTVPSRVTKPVTVSAVTDPTQKGRKAAFTLRLDADRHLRLRLASAVTGRSSQQLVTEALDHWLEQTQPIGDFAQHVLASSQQA